MSSPIAGNARDVIGAAVGESLAGPDNGSPIRGIVVGDRCRQSPAIIHGRNEPKPAETYFRGSFM